MFHVGSLQVDAPTERHIVLTRVFDAPKALVFEALTIPDLLRWWVGPHGFVLDACEMDVTAGGPYRFRIHGPCGTTIRWHGVYLEVAPDDRLAQAEIYDDWQAEPAIVTTTLAGGSGMTTVTTAVRYPSRQLRDVVLGSGMTRGLAEGYDKLAELMSARVIA